jgi:hypothetical protein
MNRERRKEAGKVFLDLAKYLATTVAISGLFTKETVNWMAAVLGVVFSVVLFVVGVKIIPPDKEG